MTNKEFQMLDMLDDLNNQALSLDESNYFKLMKNIYAYLEQRHCQHLFSMLNFSNFSVSKNLSEEFLYNASKKIADIIINIHGTLVHNFDSTRAEQAVNSLNIKL